MPVRPLGKFAGRNRYSYLTRQLREAAYHERTAPMREAMVLALAELVAQHHILHPTCRDQGPTTCPTWEAIYALRKFVGGKK